MRGGEAVNKKEEELEVILDLPEDWCVRYDCEHVSAFVINDGYPFGMAYLNYPEGDPRNIDIRKEYETPGAATPRDSR